MTAGRYTIAPEGRAWAVRDAAGELVALTVYKRGAAEVARRLEAGAAAQAALRAVAAEVTPGRRPLSSDSWLPSEIVAQVLAALAEGGQP